MAKELGMQPHSLIKNVPSPSQQWKALTLHLNLTNELTRQHDYDLFTSIIAEGPAGWTVRPVTELFG